MLETIFTGHTIRMSDLVAIGPILQQQQAVSAVSGRRSLIIELHLRDGVLLRHTALTQEIFGHVLPGQDETWDQVLDTLDEQRETLITCWQQTLVSCEGKEVSHG